MKILKIQGFAIIICCHDNKSATYTSLLEQGIPSIQVLKFCCDTPNGPGDLDRVWTSQRRVTFRLPSVPLDWHQAPPPHTSMEYTSDSTKDYTVVKYTLIWGNCSSCSRGLAWQHTILNLLAILQSPLDRSFRAIYIYMYCRDHDFVSVHFFTE